MSLSDSQFLYSPALTVELVDAHIVICDVPVGTYHSVVSIFIAEKIGNDIFAVAVTDILS